VNMLARKTLIGATAAGLLAVVVDGNNKFFHLRLSLANHLDRAILRNEPPIARRNTDKLRLKFL
jgi:hypothetical protein